MSRNDLAFGMTFAYGNFDSASYLPAQNQGQGELPNVSESAELIFYPAIELMKYSVTCREMLFMRKPEAILNTPSSPPQSLRFASIDFETADYGRDSACAVSIAVAEGGRILESRTYLIRPPRKEIVFSYIHGITWMDVHDKPHFAQLWPKCSDLLRDVDFIAAHNASFDKSVMRKCCEAADLPLPSAEFVCTVKIARALWNIYPTKLPDVCKHLGIPLKHHDAESDSLACARVMMAALSEGFDPIAFLNKKPKKSKSASHPS